ncbi:hypothetical protein, partial [Pseudomonas putida]|uniref:hypothetical protein n=1 Tax=Pseudomonas putida TaxID=303 RepID=UPI002022DD46
DIHAFAANLIQPSDDKVKPLATSSTRLLLARLSSVMAFTVDSGLLETRTPSPHHEFTSVSDQANRNAAWTITGGTAGASWSPYSAAPSFNGLEQPKAIRAMPYSGYHC